ncbi:uncharacterized protein LOC129601491 isoform X2 [Paramacrobiotus metropolitanus]|uniref:uncharacterized protein LOC129601491 isoform X2 n=1 Tax=Paramacrobiotus metropolitanus TaxID=2943436 RepID=UPI002446266A|nr:uncharacterized protein LOC129601491 isoform X2 [Paramacrobiotus metropolitanus]
MCLSNTSNMTLNKPYYSRSYVKFTVDVVRDDVIQRGYVTDITDDGLVIDFVHDGPSSAELVEFSCIHILPPQRYGAHRYLKPLQENSEVEVLIRDIIGQPLTWRKATFVALVPDYGNQLVDKKGEQFALVRLPSWNPFSLTVVVNMFPPVVASDIRIRQKRFWKTVTPRTFYKVTVSYTSCHKAECPFPRSPLLYYLKQLDACMTLVWLDLTGTLIISADDIGVTVLCRQKAKRLPNKFHRLVFHLYDKFTELYYRYEALIFKSRSQDHDAFATLNTLPDVIMLEALQSLDRIGHGELERVCQRWHRLQSSAMAKTVVLLEAPDRQHNQAVYLAKALLKFTAISTRSLLLMQFSASHSYTTIRLIKEMHLELELYASFRSTDLVDYRSYLCDLEDELALYPAVNNLHISCYMNSSSAKRLVLELIMAAPHEIKYLLNLLGGNWTFCCTTKTMNDTVTGIARVLDALNLRCSIHGKLSDAVDCPHRWRWEEGERLKADLQRWPVSSAALDAITRVSEDYYPPSSEISYCQITGFRPDILRVLIRKPCMVGEEYFSSCGVQSWLRFTGT